MFNCKVYENQEIFTARTNGQQLKLEDDFALRTSFVGGRLGSESSIVIDAGCRIAEATDGDDGLVIVMLYSSLSECRSR